MADDVILSKVDSVEKCLMRIKEEYQDNPDNLRENQTKQDSILLNLERACQSSIDIAMRVVKLRSLGLPKESREAFDLIHQAGLIDRSLTKKMHGLVGFRNIAVHNYRKLDLDVVEAVLKKHLGDFLEFTRIVLKIA